MLFLFFVFASFRYLLLRAENSIEADFAVGLKHNKYLGSASGEFVAFTKRDAVKLRDYISVTMVGSAEVSESDRSSAPKVHLLEEPSAVHTGEQREREIATLMILDFPFLYGFRSDRWLPGLAKNNHTAHD